MSSNEGSNWRELLEAESTEQNQWSSALGDPYGNLMQDTTRSVQVPRHAGPPTGSLREFPETESYTWDVSGYSQFPGDPYGNAMQETTRSVRTDIFPASGGFLERRGGGFPMPGSFLEKDKLMFDSSLSATTKSAPGTTKRAAELKYLERRFIQQATTLELENMTAEEALAKWEKFLCNESSAKITKDGSQTGRASLTAIVFINVAYSFLQCTVRAKVYRTTCRTREGGSALVLEISKRSGDAVAFYHVFKRASDYMLGRPMTEAPAPPLLEAPHAPQALPAMSGGHDLHCCGVFDTLASPSSNDWGLQAQAEFAAWAASLASTPAGLNRLHTALHEVHEALARLLLSAHIAAAYPAAVAVAAVLASPHAGVAAGPAAEARAKLQHAAARAAESANEPLVRAALG